MTPYITGHTISRASSSNRWLKTSRRSTLRRGTLNRQRSLSFAIRKDYENQDVDRVVEEILANETENEARATLRRRETIRQMSSSMSTKRRIRLVLDLYPVYSDVPSIFAGVSACPYVLYLRLHADKITF